MASALEGLPQEVLIRVASFLTTAELGLLRCTCKQIETKLFNTFANEFFTKRQFMLEHESLEALVGISRHPGLAAKLTEVIIGTQALSAGVELVRDRILNGRLSRDTLLQTGTARDMLVEAFSNLPNLRTVGLRDYDGAGRDRDGPNARWRSWGWSFGFQGASQDPGQVLSIVLNALGKAAARPSNLEAFLRRWPHLPLDSFILPGKDPGRDSTAVLANLKTLMLAVTGNAHEKLSPWAPYDDHNPTEAPLRNFLRSASRLEHLRLNFEKDSFMGHRFVDWLSRPAPPTSIQQDIFHTPSIHPATLTSLDLGMANVGQEVLIRVLSKFDLKSFSLWKMVLQSPGPDTLSTDCWSDFLKQLSSALRATSRIRSVSIGSASQHHFTPSQPSSHSAMLTRFVPEGSDITAKAKATKLDMIAYQGQFTNKTVQQWLLEMSELTFVPGIHTTLRSTSPISVDGSDEEVLEDESDGSEEDD